MSDEKGYNGWTNYETWRINLEILDDYPESSPETIEEFAEKDDAHGLSEVLEECVDDVLTNYGQTKEDDLCLSYARAFVQEVNFYEIAQHMIDDYWSEKQYEAKNAKRYGAECPSCGRDNSEYHNICTSDDCPSFESVTSK